MKSKSTEPSSAEGAWRQALRLLESRDYTAARLRDKLRSRGFSDQHTEEAIHRLEEGRWISDRRYAERFCEAALAAGRYTGPRLRLELTRRGVPAETVAEVLPPLLEEHDEEDQLKVLLERRFSAFSGASASDREKRRVAGYLQRRGFRMSTILKAFRES